MVRNIVIFGCSSHPGLTKNVCEKLGISEGKITCGKFASGETRIEVNESVRGKDVYVVQTASGPNGAVNDFFIEMLVTISACKTGQVAPVGSTNWLTSLLTASAAKVTAVMPLYPYSRQSDIPYNKSGAPLFKASDRPYKYNVNGTTEGNQYTFESVPSTPYPERFDGHLSNGHGNGNSNGNGINMNNIQKAMSRANLKELGSSPTSHQSRYNAYKDKEKPEYFNRHVRGESDLSANGVIDRDFMTVVAANQNKPEEDFKPRPGYRQWVAQAGTLVADLLMCAGADHIITMDLHDSQTEGYFVSEKYHCTTDNLYGRPLLKKYIQRNIDFKNGVIVSPDAGGAKRATAIADSLGINFAIIHKNRKQNSTDRQNATMMLVGDVAGKIAILIDDLADTSSKYTASITYLNSNIKSDTVTRAAKLCAKLGAVKVYALLTHGVFSGDALNRINQCDALDKVVVTNTVDQVEHSKRCSKIETLDVSNVFAEAIRRVHYGESLSVLYQYD